MTKFVMLKKYLPVALALAGFAAASTAPALAHSVKSNGLHAYAMVPNASVPFGIEAPDRFSIAHER
jgi:hypothetical protein